MDIEKIISNTLNAIELTKEEIEKSLWASYNKGVEDGRNGVMHTGEEYSPYETKKE